MSEQERAETAQSQPEAQSQLEAQSQAEIENQPEAQSQPGGLTPVERRILEVERRRFKHQGSKEKAIIAAGFTPIAYYQRLNVMLDDERVRAAAPQMIDVLRARRDATRGSNCGSRASLPTPASNPAHLRFNQRLNTVRCPSLSQPVAGRSHWFSLIEPVL